jgi:hypothetical protein
LIKRLRIVPRVALLLGTLLLQGCFAYRVPAPYRPVAVDGGEVVWAFAWGLAVEHPRLGRCSDLPLTYVTARSNVGFTLLTVLTLGLVAPIKLEWGCTPAPTDTIIGATPRASLQKRRGT